MRPSASRSSRTRATARQGSVTSATPRRILVTGARWSDLLLCVLRACLIVGTSGRLRVYFRVFVAEVSVARVNADGRRHPLPTPEVFRRVGLRPLRRPRPRSSASSGASRPTRPRPTPPGRRGPACRTSRASSGRSATRSTRPAWTARASWRSAARETARGAGAALVARPGGIPARARRSDQRGRLPHRPGRHAGGGLLAQHAAGWLGRCGGPSPLRTRASLSPCPTP